MQTVFPFQESVDADWMKDVDNRVQFGIKFGKSRGFLKSGDPIVIVRSSLFFRFYEIIYWFSFLGNWMEIWLRLH